MRAAFAIGLGLLLALFAALAVRAETDDRAGSPGPLAYVTVAGAPGDGDRALAAAAHARGLSIALKNDVDQVAALQPDFDFAIVEQCYEYDECGLTAPFTKAGKAVLDAEYSGSTGSYC
ncbi:MAG: endo alpha-1,4 polygalactosaminidase, partial [Methyloceanibacter sp.]